MSVPDCIFRPLLIYIFNECVSKIHSGNEKQGQPEQKNISKFRFLFFLRTRWKFSQYKSLTLCRLTFLNYWRFVGFWGSKTVKSSVGYNQPSVSTQHSTHLTRLTLAIFRAVKSANRQFRTTGCEGKFVVFLVFFSKITCISLTSKD